jgi:hypothetical protein
VCAQARCGTLSGCIWFAFLRWNEPLPTDRKAAAGLSPVIELENEFIGDIERDWQGFTEGRALSGRRGRIVLDHGPDPPFLVLCAESPALAQVSVTNAVPQAIDLLPQEARLNPRAIHAVRKWVPARPTKFADQLPDRSPSMAERVHQPFQTDPVTLVPLLGNVGSAPPNGVSIHLFGPAERRLKRLLPHHTLVNAFVRVCCLEGESPGTSTRQH